MDPARASITALGTAWMRAVHTRLDRPALIDDDWGDRLVTDADREMFLQVGMCSLPPDARQQVATLDSTDEKLAVIARTHPSYGQVIIRTRYAEDALAESVSRGVRQCVIIGAGMDSLAMRRPGFGPDMEVFEIDHPATQEFKLTRLAECGADPAAGVHYLPADLSEQELDVVLTESGFDSERIAFFSWLGVTRYLTREANLKNFEAIASCGADGSEVVFNYLDQAAFDGTDPEAERLRAMFSALGEPWVSGFHPSELGEQLRGVGLELIEDLGSEELRRRYCADRDDGLASSPGEHIARAQVVA